MVPSVKFSMPLDTHDASMAEAITHTQVVEPAAGETGHIWLIGHFLGYISVESATQLRDALSKNITYAQKLLATKAAKAAALPKFWLWGGKHGGGWLNTNSLASTHNPEVFDVDAGRYWVDFCPGGGIIQSVEEPPIPPESRKE